MSSESDWQVTRNVFHGRRTYGGHCSTRVVSSNSYEHRLDSIGSSRKQLEQTLPARPKVPNWKRKESTNKLRRIGSSVLISVMIAKLDRRNEAISCSGSDGAALRQGALNRQRPTQRLTHGVLEQRELPSRSAGAPTGHGLHRMARPRSLLN